jgi:RHH-type proline utilization regulon transcriptional repressor/proline dehydrogenase/delta 1-pyrroline-5-carboxylate dehydrogenase
MLYGAMDELALGDPWELSTDIGPVISAEAQAGIWAHIAAAEREGRILKRLTAPGVGHFVAPVAIRLPGIEVLDREVFGPVLHVATFRSEDLDRVVDAINAKGYGLTFALHSRIDDRVEQVAARVAAGNIYINRNQIGAVVGSQPFGGEGLSGTGPKAGGPAYLRRFVRPRAAAGNAEAAAPVAVAEVQRALDRLAGQGRRVTARENLPGPTGESNRLTTLGRGVVLCLGPGADRARAQAAAVCAAGAEALAIAPGLAPDEGLSGTLAPEALGMLSGFDAVVCEGREAALRPMRAALAARDGALLPLLAEGDFARWVVIERHLCIDTTASGGNAALLASAG